MLHTISGLRNILSTKMLDESLVTIKNLKQIKRNTHIVNKRSQNARSQRRMHLKDIISQRLFQN